MSILTQTFSTVGVGSTSNDGTGDTLRNAFIKVNNNFRDITEIGFNAGNILVSGAIESFGSITSRSALFIGNATPLSFPNCVLNAITSADSYSQLNIQNTNSGTSASSDFIATTSDGTDAVGYIDLGINGSGYNNPNWTISGPRDGYLFVNNGNLTIGTDTAARVIRIHAGGTRSANVVATFAQDQITLAANLALANIGVPTASNSVGIVGQVAFDSGNIYICVAANTWRRAALSTF